MVRDHGQAWRSSARSGGVRNTSGRYLKTDFTLDHATGQLTCPAG
jgi:hypothetical protein